MLVRVMVSQHRAGTRPRLELLVAQASYFRTCLRLSEAEHARAVAFYALERAIGERPW